MILKRYQLNIVLNNYGFRFYDPAIARFTTIDPLAEQFPHQSGYVYADNDPIGKIDFMGLSGQTTIVGDNGDGTYTVKDWIDDGKTDVVLDDGTKVGESLTTHSFVNEHNDPVVGAVIDTRSSEGQDFIDDEIIRDDPNIFDYKDNATLNEHFDLKSRGLKEGATGEEALIHRTRGSMTSDGKMASARDFGNMGAGIVAGRTVLPNWIARMKFNKLQGGKEPPVSAKAQEIGLQIGSKMYYKENSEARSRLHRESGGF